MRRETMFGGLIVLALIAFELFNFSTTDFALTDLLGDLRFVGVRWATILAIAFCGMDFAGIAWLFTPDSSARNRVGAGPTLAKGQPEHVEVWYLLGAWFLAATMNAVLTWWGVSLALMGHTGLGNEILNREQLLSGVPVFVAILVWLIRILLIGTFTVAGDRLFRRAEDAPGREARPAPLRPARVIGGSGDAPPVKAPVSARPDQTPVRPRPAAPGSRPFRPAPKPRAPSNGGQKGKQREFQKSVLEFPQIHPGPNGTADQLTRS